MHKCQPALGLCAIPILFCAFPVSSSAENMDEGNTGAALWCVLLLWFALICLLLCSGEVRDLLFCWVVGELLVLVFLCEEASSSVCLGRETSVHFCDASSCCCSFSIFSRMLFNSAGVENQNKYKTHMNAIIQVAEKLLPALVTFLCFICFLPKQIHHGYLQYGSVPWKYVVWYCTALP